jgi:hypothetical protein
MASFFLVQKFLIGTDFSLAAALGFCIWLIGFYV